MARASISFEDTEDGVVMTLNFDTDLPEDPEDATQAQMEAMVAFQAWASVALGEGEQEVVFNDGESEEAASEV